MIRRLNAYYENVRGLTTKSFLFFVHLASFTYIVIILTETCLFSEKPSIDYFPGINAIFRSEPESSASKICGGGVFIAVNKSFNCRKRSDQETGKRSVWVEVSCGNNN